MSVWKERCRHFSHSRPDPPTRCCIMCGEVVNADIPTKECAEENHYGWFYGQHEFYAHCGAPLKKAPDG